jgi:hypothetical protein
MAITIQSPRPNAAASPRNIPRGCFRRIPHTTRTSNAPTHRAIAMVAGTCCALPSLARACPSGEWPALEIRAQTIGPRTPATVPATTMAESFFCTTPASRPDVAASDACLARPLCLPDGRWALADRPPSDVGLFRGPRTSTCPPRRRFPLSIQRSCIETRIAIQFPSVGKKLLESERDRTAGCARDAGAGASPATEESSLTTPMMPALQRPGLIGRREHSRTSGARCCSRWSWSGDWRSGAGESAARRVAVGGVCALVPSAGGRVRSYRGISPLIGPRR